MRSKTGLGVALVFFLGISGAAAQDYQQKPSDFSNRGACADEARVCLSQCRTRSFDDMTADLHCKQQCEAVKASCLKDQDKEDRFKDNRLKEDRLKEDQLKQVPPSPLGEPR